MISISHKEFNCIDLLKYLMALAVVTIHNEGFDTHIRNTVPAVWFIRTAVPFFFIATGFFLGKRAKEFNSAPLMRKYLRNKAATLIKIFGLWLLVYMPITIYYYASHHTPFPECLYLFAEGVILRGESPMSWALWYIYSLAIVLYLLSLASNKGYMYGLMALFFIVYLLNYYSFVGNINQHKIIAIAHMLFSRTLGGGIYILSGLALYNILHSPYMTKRLVYMLIVSSAAFSWMLFYLVLPLWDVLSGIVFVAIGILIKLPNAKLWISLRAQSKWIYFLHMYIIYGLSLASSFWFHKQMPCYVPLTYILSISLGYFMYRVQKIPIFNKIGILIT